MTPHTRIACIVLLLIIGVALSTAQTTQQGNVATTPSLVSPPSYYYASRPGELTILVNVWGFVEKPGRYEVPSTTDLIQLISLAGGPKADGKIDNVRITRMVRRDGGLATKEFTVDLERLDRVDPSKLTLYPGDVVFIDHTSWLTLRDVFSVVATAAIVTTAVTQILLYAREK
jgi:hypothetical protein